MTKLTKYLQYIKPKPFLLFLCLFYLVYKIYYAPAPIEFYIKGTLIAPLAFLLLLLLVNWSTWRDTYLALIYALGGIVLLGGINQVLWLIVPNVSNEVFIVLTLLPVLTAMLISEFIFFSESQNGWLKFLIFMAVMTCLIAFVQKLESHYLAEPFQRSNFILLGPLIYFAIRVAVHYRPFQRAR